MNLQDELKALKERIAELEELAKEEQEFPQENDTYWYINMFGGVLDGTFVGSITDRGKLEIGNVFKTEQEAKFAVEKLMVEAELRKFGKPFEPMTDNYFIVFVTQKGDLDTGNRRYVTAQGAIYFESEEKIQQAVSEIGEERIKKYIFGVED